MTLEEEKRLALLAAILKSDGGKKTQILDVLESLDLLRLSADDHELMRNRKEKRWRNNLAYVRKHLVDEGYISDSTHDDWRITDTGRNYASELSKRARTLGNGSYVKLKRASAVIQESLETFQNDEAGVSKETIGIDGTKKLVWTVRYERKPKLRSAAIQFHGTRCMGCGFSFSEAYGEQGAGFIEVHHLKPIGANNGPTRVNAETDLVVLCSNCHSVVHRRANRPLSLQELKASLKRKWPKS